MFVSSRHILWCASWPISMYLNDLDLVHALRAKIKIDQTRSKWVYSEPSRREEHDGGKITSLTWFCKELFDFEKSNNFAWPSVTSTAEDIDLRSNLMAHYRKSVFKSSRLLFSLCSSYNSLRARPEEMKACHFYRKYRTFFRFDLIWPRRCWPRATKFSPEKFHI